MTSNVSTEKESLITLVETRLRHLSLDRLRVANDFLAYLEEREENEATEELLSIPDFEVAFAQAQAEVDSNNLASFNSIRRDV